MRVCAAVFAEAFLFLLHDKHKLLNIIFCILIFIPYLFLVLSDSCSCSISRLAGLSNEGGSHNASIVFAYDQPLSSWMSKSMNEGQAPLSSTNFKTKGESLGIWTQLLIAVPGGVTGLDNKTFEVVP
jgi:hypothetical protein